MDNQDRPVFKIIQLPVRMEYSTVDGKTVIIYSLQPKADETISKKSISPASFSSLAGYNGFPALVKSQRDPSSESIEIYYMWLDQKAAKVLLRSGTFVSGTAFEDIVWTITEIPSNHPGADSKALPEKLLYAGLEAWWKPLETGYCTLLFASDDEFAQQLLNIRSKSDSQRRKTVVEELNANYRLAESLPLDVMRKILLDSEEAYYNELEDPTIILNDQVYDYAKDLYRVRMLASGNPVSGTRSNGMEHVPQPVGRMMKLPIWMGSLTKVNHGSGQMALWTSQFPGPYLASAKMDGASALYFEENGVVKLYSRGKGSEGQDITELLQYLKMPPLDKGVLIRGELIIKRSVFNQKYKRTDPNDKSKYRNPRNATAGLVNKLGARAAGSKNAGSQLDVSFIDDVDFIAYEAVTTPAANASLQYQYLVSKFGQAKVAPHLLLNAADDATLSAVYDKFLAEVDYDTDGVVISSDHAYQRFYGENPTHIRAYKKPLAILSGVTRVIHVEWEASKDALLKPVAVFEPVELDGVTICRSTGYNAKFIVDSGIGPGAIIEITRSGGVIPKIIKILQPVEPQMPATKYLWNETKVDILLDDVDDPNSAERKLSNIKKLHFFLTTIGTKGIGIETTTSLYNMGCTKIPWLLLLKPEHLQHLGPKVAENIVATIREHMVAIPLPTLAAASGCFGRGMGVRKMKVVFDKYPTILDFDLEKANASGELNQAILALEGFQEKSANKVIKGLFKFLVFLEEMKAVGYIHVAYRPPTNQTVVDNHPLKGLNVVMTGFRDAEIKNFVESVGGVMQSTFSGKTNLLIIKDGSCHNNKTIAAQEKGVAVITKDEFLRQYLGR